MKKLIVAAHGHAKRHYHAYYKSRYHERAHLVYLFDAVLVSAALFLLALGSYFAWFYHPLRDDFRLGVATVGEMVGGQEGEISVFIENVGKETLRNATLAVHLPASFLAADGQVGTRMIEIGLLPEGASAQYRFRGTPLGAPQDARIVAHFTAEGDAGRHDEKLASADLRWEKNLVETRFEAPSAIVPGQTARFRLFVKNGAAFPIDSASVKLTWPEGFRLINATPPVYRGIAALGTLEPGAEAVVEIAGRFASADDFQSLEAALNGTVDGRAFTLAEADSDIQLLDAGLELSAVFADAAPAYAAPGEEMPVVVRYRNDGAELLQGVTLGIAEDARTIASVRWEESADVGDLAPGENGQRTAFVRVLDPVSRYVTDPTLRVTPTARFSLGKPGLEDVDAAGAGAERKISGDATLRAAARYFTSEGDQIGRGPLPPKVGATTRYWVFASLATGATRLDGATLSFDLPAGVAWTGRASVTAGDDLVLAGDRLVWRLGTIAAHASVLHEAPSVSFEVALTPTAAQAGTSPALLSSAAFTATDAWTGADLAETAAGLTTALPGDPKVAGRTVVRP